MGWQMLFLGINWMFSEQVPHCGAPRNNQTADQLLARLDVASLVPTARKLFDAGLANTTRKTYRVGANRYARFCEGTPSR